MGLMIMIGSTRLPMLLGKKSEKSGKLLGVYLLVNNRWFSLMEPAPIFLYIASLCQLFSAAEEIDCTADQYD